jgi:hypothetical protein
MFSGLPLITDIDGVLARRSQVSITPSCRALQSGGPQIPRTADGLDTPVCCPLPGYARCSERLRFSPRFKHRSAFPYGMGSIQRVILGFRAFEKVKRYSPGTLLRRLSRESQACSTAASDPLAARKRLIATIVNRVSRSTAHAVILRV